MEYVFDIFLLLILMLVTFISTKRGFVRSVWSYITIIGSFAVAYAFGSAIGEYFCFDFILPRVTEYTFEIISGMVASTEGSYNLSELFNSLPEEFVHLAESSGISLASLQQEFVSVVAMSQEQVYDIANSIASPVSLTLSHAIGIIVTFLVSVIVLTIIGLIVKIISKIPVIKALDGILGFVFGIIKGAVIVCIICVAAAIIVECEFMNGEIGTYFKILTEKSYIFRFFCTFSPVDFINIG